MIRILVLISILMIGKCSFEQPSIISFMPASGPIGTTVVITGTNFRSVPSDNIVFFGTAKATVTTATFTQLTVIVPLGADYRPITVTVNELTAYSAHPFIVTFSGADESFTAQSFVPKVDISPGGVNIALADLDSDGKNDLAITSPTTNAFLCYRNIGSSGSIAFAPKIDVPTNSNPHGIVTGDLDGDGKLDIAITNANANNLSILRNLSISPGTIAFAQKIDFPTGDYPVSNAIGDLDGDGKADIVVTNQFGNTISIYRNTSSRGNISFAAKIDSGTGNGPVAVFVSDLDGDLKADVCIVNYGENSVSLYRNTSHPGTISFAPKINLLTGNTPLGVAVGDLDADGLSEIAVTNGIAGSISIYKNMSTSGNLSFNPKQDISTDLYAYPIGISIGDLDGDGKPEIVASTNRYYTAAVFKNTSLTGSISFEPKLHFFTYNSPLAIALADIDIDGKPDIISVSNTSISLLRNQIGEPSKINLCPSTNTTFTSNVSGTTYQWQVNMGSGFIDISDNNNYIGANTASLQLNAVPSYWYGYIYQCLVNGSNISKSYKIQFINTWTGNSNNSWENTNNWSCGMIPDENTDIIINSGNVVLHSTGICRSIIVKPSVIFTIDPGYKLTVTH